VGKKSLHRVTKHLMGTCKAL